MSENQRHLWAADMLNVQPGDNLLEVGCGPGVTADTVARQLQGGRLHALDRSEAMIRQAAKRNQKWIDQGKMMLIHGHFAKEALPSISYDKIYAFNVSLFLKDDEGVFNLLRQVMGQNGKFYFFSQPPFNDTRDIVTKAQKHLEKHGFEIMGTEVASFQPSPTFCITISCPKTSNNYE